METILMECGHIANATTKEDKPICAICLCDKIKETKIIDLTGRKAKCNECDFETDSNVNLPFFQYRPDKEKDRFYCGCHGWD